MRRDCADCKNFDVCYRIASGNDVFPDSLPEYFESIRKRDLCAYNDKMNWEPRNQ